MPRNNNGRHISVEDYIARLKKDGGESRGTRANIRYAEIWGAIPARSRGEKKKSRAKKIVDAEIAQEGRSWER